MFYIEPTGNGWIDFWNSVGEFFMVKDTSGLNYLTRILISIGIILAGYILIRLIRVLLKRAFKVKRKGPDLDVSAKFFVIKIIEFFLWIGVAFAVIAMLKIEVTGLAGVVSAVTVALGLALQDLISCFASGLLILHQKHIVTGDFIGVKNALGAVEGKVTKIHLFFTYLVTPQGQEVTIPNNTVTKAIITNYTRLNRRRIDYDVGVAYDTDIELAKQVLLDIVKDDSRLLEGEAITAYVYELGQNSVGLRLRVWTPFDQYWPLYNELSEKVLIAFRKNNIVIPTITNLTVNQK